MFSVKNERINFKTLLSRPGGLTEVYPYQKDPTDDKWAIKIQPVESNILGRAFQEVVLGFNCDHPNVLSVHGYHLEFNENENNWKLYTKMPRMVETLYSKLDQHIKDQKKFSEAEIIKYFYDIASGLSYLHKRKIAHRDIKLENILLDKKGSAVIGNVGIGKLIEDGTESVAKDFAGTLRYVAPEILNFEGEFEKEMFYKADSWSLGITMAELCLLKPVSLKVHLSGDKKEAILTEQLGVSKGNKNSKLIDLVLSLLRHKPDERNSVEVVKQIIEEEFGYVLELQKYNKSIQTEEIFEEKKLQELIDQQETNKEIAKLEDLDPNIWKEKVKEVIEKLEKAKGEFFSFMIKDYEQEVGIKIEPKDSSKVDDNNLKALIEEFITTLNEENWKHFKVFAIALRCCEQLSDEALINLAEKLGTRFTNLKFLEIDVQNCQKTTDHAIKELGRQIGTNLKNLEVLNLYFFNTPTITDDGAEHLMEEIAVNLKGLQQLELNLGKCKISDFTVSKFSYLLSKEFKNLTKLSLYFRGCLDLTENTTMSLFDQLAINFNNLQTFNLSLSECNISDNTINNLSEKFANGFKKLKSLRLVFANSENITNQAVKELVRQICLNLNDLSSFDLGLQGCIQITDDTIEIIGKNIADYLKKLQILTLWLEELPIKNQTIEYLSECLAEIPEFILELDE